MTDILNDLKKQLIEEEKAKGKVRNNNSDKAEEPTRQGSSEAADLSPGKLLLGTYRIESDAIKGGMGAVWRVHHTGWDMDLAMKKPKAELFRTEEQKKNFSDECRYWMNLGLHPNIVSCYYVREIEGVPAIFSEWMENGSLESHIKDGTLYSGTEEEVKARLLDIAIQFARGLRYAHENNLIHQDVKPDNLLLTEGWTAKVSDFGLAKARTMLTFLEGAATELEEDSDITLVSPSGGRTPAYCSPEQAAAQLLTIRTDIYSWAVSVLEMYLGYKPWAHGRALTGPLAGSACRDYFALCEERPIPKALQTLLAQCMEQDPNNRPADFNPVEATLKDIFRDIAGYEYFRTEPRKAAETATSLNNRALSYLDLGETEEAENLLKQAIRKDPNDFYSNYNYALLLWNRGSVSDRAFHDSIFKVPDSCRASSVARVKINLCTRADMKETEECMRALERWSVPVSVKDEIAGSLEEWRKIEHISVDDDYLPAEGFAEAFPRLEVRSGKPLRILEKRTGRILREMNIVSIYYLKTYTCEEWLQGYSLDGAALLFAEYNMKRCIQLPDADLPFYYEPAVIENQKQRASAERQGKKEYYAAKHAWDMGDIEKAAGILKESLKRNTLILHEPSMQLWTQLGKYYKKGRLVTVVPTEEPASPFPVSDPDTDRICQKEGDIFNQGWMCISCDGVTEIKLDCSYLDARESLNLNTEADFVFRITGKDVSTDREFFVIDPFFKETSDDDDGPFALYQIRMKTPGEIEFWSQYQSPVLYDFRGTSEVRFALPGGYELQNCPEGVDIGGVKFDDTFVEFRPLFDAEIVPCEKRNYRLIYEYEGV